MSLKSKLSQRDLDEVLAMLKSNDISMKSFSQYEPITLIGANQQTNSAAENSTTSTIAITKSNNETKLNNSNLNNSSNIDNAELDSTLVVGTGDNNSTLNTSSIIVAL